MADLSDPALLAAMQAFSWTWESDFESDNVLQRRIHEELLAEIIRDGMGKGEFRKLDLQRTVTSLWAIYTWGLRSGVFDGTSPEQCAKAINDQARDLLCEQG